MSSFSHTRGATHRDTPAVGQRHGILIADPMESRARELTSELVRLDAEVAWVSGGAEALSQLEGASAAEMLIIRGDQPDMSAAELCQRVRADSRLTGIYILLLGSIEVAPLVGRGPDEALVNWTNPDELRTAVRAALRTQARRRVLARQERRHAITWLGKVVNHEINNPLSAALSAHSRIQEILEAEQGIGPEARAELVELLSESEDALRSIHGATGRLTRRSTPPTATAAHVSLSELTQILRNVVTRRGASATIDVERRSALTCYCDGTFVEHTLGQVVDAIRTFGGNALAIRVHVDAFRIAIIVETQSEPARHPEELLEARLVSVDGAPPHFEAGLSALEDALDRFGGQLFATRLGGRVRFSLTLPNDEQATS